MQPLWSLPLHEHESAIRLGAFVAALAVLGLAERFWPRRAAVVTRSRRWINNLLMLVFGVLLLRVVLPVLAVAWAVQVEGRGWGLFHLLALPYWIEFALTLLLLDLTIYWQHRMMHLLPWLWRLHRVHHSDLDFDASTGVRFHPFEILFSMLIKLAVVTLLGAPPDAVLIFEVLLNLTSLFEHTNLRLPSGFDRRLRLLLVTPDMHRVHHSIHSEEYNRNFGFNFPWWDRLFRSYCAQPRAGHLAMVIGLPKFRLGTDQRLDMLLLQPFKDST